MAAHRRSKMFGRRRRVEDEGDEEGGPDHLDLDDDSLTEGSIASDDHEHDVDSDTSNIDEASPVARDASKPKSTANGTVKPTNGAQPDQKPTSDTQVMMHGLDIAQSTSDIPETHFDDSVAPASKPASTTARSSASSGPLVVSSSSAPRQATEPTGDRRRREHEEYKKKRDEDPAFVPNRGAFFMHDHRHAGPAANGFRPFGRGRGGGRGRGTIGGPFAPVNQFRAPPDPLTSGNWAHDMHEAVADPMPARQPRGLPNDEGPANGNGIIPTCPPNPKPINRTMSTEKHLGNVQVRVSLPTGSKTSAFPMPVRQYTKLPDHRPPLRRDKPVRISLPENAPKYIFPAPDRSFIFIPRAMRPNQQRTRGKPRSGLGSVGGFSRRTSVVGGGSFYGSTYSPSVAMSRRSSIVHDGRDYMFSPTGSVISRPPMPVENPRPVVRLPPSAHPQQPPMQGAHMPMGPDVGMPFEHQVQVAPMMMQQPSDYSISGLPPPQTHPLPQKPTFQENRQPLPMHQPRPQKTVSVADIESPTLNQQPFGQAFHQQVPVQVSNGFHDSHSRQPSYQSHHSTGTPLSQIPERAIHAAPFQPNNFSQQGYYGHQAYPVMQPQQQQPPQGYYYPQSFPGPSATAAPFVPTGQHTQGQSYGQPPAPDTQGHQQPGQPGAPSNMVAQEVNGMVYYYDASQMPAMSSYPGYQGPQGYGAGVPGMGGMVTPSPDTFFYPPAPGMVYYPQ